MLIKNFLSILINNQNQLNLSQAINVKLASNFNNIFLMSLPFLVLLQLFSYLHRPFQLQHIPQVPLHRNYFLIEFYFPCYSWSIFNFYIYLTFNHMTSSAVATFSLSSTLLCSSIYRRNPGHGSFSPNSFPFFKKYSLEELHSSERLHLVIV